MKGGARWAAAGIAAGGAIVAALLLLAVLGGAVMQPAAAQPAGLNTRAVPAQYVQWVEKAGAECPAVSPPQIAAQLDQESGWRPGAVSSAGADGIAQFLPRTWVTWGRRDAPGPVSPFNAPDAIMAMGRYDCGIAAKVARVPGGQLGNMLAGYNAGPAAVLQADGIPPFAQTQQYVASIEALIPRYETALAGPPAGGSAFAQAEVTAAERFLGTPYVWGGGGPGGPTGGGFDCSGLVVYAVFQASHGTILLPHSSEIQATRGTPVPGAGLEPGDVIAIEDNPKSDPGDFSHIVIYIGGGMVIQAPHTGQDVDEIPLSDFAGLPQTIRRFG